MAYSSSNNTVATIDSSTGLITVLAPGVTTITATIAWTTNYTGDSESQTLQVVGLPGSASTIFTENMGTPSGTVAIASHTFQNSTSSLTYSNGGQTNSADIRNTNTSSGYSGSSGSGNVFFTSTPGHMGLQSRTSMPRVTAICNYLTLIAKSLLPHSRVSRSITGMAPRG